MSLTRASSRRVCSPFRLLLALTAVLLVAGCGNIDDKHQRWLDNQGGGGTPPPPPQELAARIFSSSWARVGFEMDLDATGSTGKAPLAYQWSLVSAPVGSTAAIVSPNAELALFTPDQVGEYEFELVVTESAGAAKSIRAITTVVPPATFVSRVQAGEVEWTNVRENRVEVINLEHPVDLERTVFMMTVRAIRKNPRFSRYMPRYAFLDDRTIELRTGAVPNDPLFVSWTVIEFTPDAVIGVERGSVDRATGSNGVLDIPLARPVDPEHAFVLPSLHQAGTNFVYEIPHSFTAALLPSGATLRLESNGNPDPGKTESQWQVVEFTPDSGVQVSFYEWDVAPARQLQAFNIEPVSLRESFIISAGSNIVTTNTQFPVRQAYWMAFADPETVAIRKNTNGSTPSEYRIAAYVVSVAGARVESFFGQFAGNSATPAVPPSWSAFDPVRLDPVVMSGWNAFQSIAGNAENTSQTELLYTVKLNAATDGVEIERGSVEADRQTREFSGYVVGWPRHD